MKEIVIRSHRTKPLKVISAFLSFLGFEVVSTWTVETFAGDTSPIIYADQPDFRALAGIWANRFVDQNELRQRAWGDRQ